MTYRAIDASVVIAKMLDEERPRWVDEAVTAARHDKLDLIAPTLMWVEVGNRLVRRDMTDEQALDAMLRVEAIGIETVELQRPIRLRAVQLGREHQLSMYDATYLAVAESTRAPLLTLDAELERAAKTMGLGRPGHGRVPEPVAPYGDKRPVDQASIAAIGAALAEMRREYSR